MVIALAITIVGCGLWAYAAATRPAATSPPAGSASSSALVSGFASQEAGTAPVQTPVEPRLIDDAGPAVARFGGSFVAGFCIAFAVRKIFKVAALIIGVGLIGLFALQYWGVVDVKFDLITDHLQSSFAWLQGKAGTMKDFIVGYLPSGAAGVTGMVVGARHR